MCTHACSQACMHMHMCARVDMHKHTHVHTNTCIHMHMFTHTHTSPSYQLCLLYVFDGGRFPSAGCILICTLRIIQTVAFLCPSPSLSSCHAEPPALVFLKPKLFAHGPGPWGVSESGPSLQAAAGVGRGEGSVLGPGQPLLILSPQGLHSDGTNACEHGGTWHYGTWLYCTLQMLHAFFFFLTKLNHGM